MLLYSVFLPLLALCKLTTADSQGYAHSLQLPLSSTPLTLQWNDQGSGVVKFGVTSGPNAPGWVGIGFNLKGSMTPSRAIIAFTTSNDTQRQNPQLMEYLLKATSQSGVLPVNQTVIFDTSVKLGSDDSWSFSFSINTKDEPNISLSVGHASGIIFASGPAPNSPFPFTKHTATGTVTLGLDGGVKATFGGKEGPDWTPAKTVVHALIMASVWFLIIPVAATFAAPSVRTKLFRSDTQANPKFTFYHRLLASIGAILALIAFVIGYFAIGTRTFILHFVLGTIVLCFMVILIIGGVWRTRIFMQADRQDEKQEGPGFAYKHRHTISTAHRWLGRLTWALAVANCFVGINIYDYPLEFYILAGCLTAIALIFFLVGTFMRRQ